MLLSDIIEQVTAHSVDNEIEPQQVQQSLPKDPFVNLDPFQALKIKGIQKQVDQWLRPWPTKKMFAVTEVTGCILQTYIKLMGLVTAEELDTSKLFYLLDVYGRMGDAVHKYIYDNYEFKQIETLLEDPENHVRGKIDGLTYDDVVWELKSGKVSGSEIKQVALQYHLMKKHNIPVKEFKVWWVIHQKVETYSLDKLESLYPDLLRRCNILYESMQTKVPPIHETDTEQCKYCPVHKVCSKLRGTN